MENKRKNEPKMMIDHRKTDLEKELREVDEAATAALAAATTAAAAREAVAAKMLKYARQLLVQGNPSQAFQMLMIATITKNGEAAALQLLGHVQEIYKKKLQESVEAHKLASLFAECAIMEADPMTTELEQNPTVDELIDVSDESNMIADDKEKNELMLDAFVDGSSMICLKCGNLVSKELKEEHLC